MNVAVLSDTHDHLDRLAKALAAVRDSGAAALVFCGDLCAPFTLAALAEGYAGPIHAVFGNNDGDRMMLLTIAAQHPHVQSSWGSRPPGARWSPSCHRPLHRLGP